MHIGILETGAPPGDLSAHFGRYSAMMERMIGPGHRYSVFDVTHAAPPRPDACDAFMITGSSAGVYDDLPWIAPMEAFLRAAAGRVPLIGVCFGHQLMAQAFGGAVEKSAKGWCAGLHAYRVTAHEPWMDGAEVIRIPASHQDQVVAQPPNTRIFLASDFTPIAGLAYADQSAISLQGHPEFEPAFAQALYESRRGVAYDEAQADAAIASLAAANDRARVAAWLRAFLDGAAPGNQTPPAALTP